MAVRAAILSDAVQRRRASAQSNRAHRSQVSVIHRPLPAADHNILQFVQHRGSMRAREALVFIPSSPTNGRGRDEGKRARVRVLRSADSNSDHVRMLAALDGVARRPALGDFKIVRQR